MVEFYIFTTVLALALSVIACVLDYKAGGVDYLPDPLQAILATIVCFIPIFNLTIVLNALFYILAETD